MIIFTGWHDTRLIPGPRKIDDAYITYRYARNILAGNGFVYNPAEHVLGTITPFYTILLVFSGYVAGGSTAPFPLISLMINALADGVTCILLIQLQLYKVKTNIPTDMYGSRGMLIFERNP